MNRGGEIELGIEAVDNNGKGEVRSGLNFIPRLFRCARGEICNWLRVHGFGYLRDCEYFNLFRALRAGSVRWRLLLSSLPILQLILSFFTQVPSICG